jgi:hypothetical protein
MLEVYHVYPIDELIEKLNLTNELEAIYLPIKEQYFALLRVKRLPHFAYLIWAFLNTWTRSALAFKGGGSYTIVCVCCSPQEYGRNTQTPSAFASMLFETCMTHDIHTIFVRHAWEWSKHYPVSSDLSVIESEDHVKELLKSYSPEHIQNALHFIDFDRSSALGENDMKKLQEGNSST